MSTCQSWIWLHNKHDGLNMYSKWICVNLESYYITNGTEVTRIQNDHVSILYFIIL